MPDRSAVTMTCHFLRSYSLLLIKTCHRRGVHAMGGMAAQIPIKGDVEANDVATAKVRGDKEREASDGFDGSWVAHPDLVPTCTEVTASYSLLIVSKPAKLCVVPPRVMLLIGVRTTAVPQVATSLSEPTSSNGSGRSSTVKPRSRA